jgi:DNA-binding CsgD family transcriptional regulator
VAHWKVVREELSEREKQVAAHLAGGLRVSGVAHELCIAEITVRNHLRGIFSKLDVHSQSELIDLLRRQPQILGPYRSLGGLEEPSLADELLEADRMTEKRIEEAFASHQGLDAMKAVIRAVLPLDEDRRREWRTRLAVHAVAPQQRDVREAFGEIRRKWASRPLGRIALFQEGGWLRPEADPDEVLRQLVAAVHAAALALLADPSPEEQRRQLADIDELLESLAAVPR